MGPIWPPPKTFLLFIYGSNIGRCVSHICFFSMGKVVSHLPLFSYIGAVSFLNFHFEKFFNILDICLFNYYACKKDFG
jgi:hypothetical protein